MKCEKCGNEYPSQYYFTTSTICNECFKQLSPEEQAEYYRSNAGLIRMDELTYRIGFGRRLGAILLDYLILVIIILMVYNFTGFFKSYMLFLESAKEFAQNQAMLQQLYQQFLQENFNNFIFTYIITLIYSSLEIFIGASLGKLILGIQIARQDRYKADYGKLALRFAVKNMAMLFSIIWLFSGLQAMNTISLIVNLVVFVGFFFTLSKKRQAFHDMIAKTAVFRKNDILEEEINQVI